MSDPGRVRASALRFTYRADEACLVAFHGELDYVCRTLRRLGTAPSDVEDLAQEVFVALRRSWTEYDPNRPLRPYLFGIAFRIASVDARWRRRHRRREVALDAVELTAAVPGPDAALERKQARALVLAALERIPLPRRAVLVTHDLDDVPVCEVADGLGIPLFTAYSRLRKARCELASALRRMLKVSR
jgi:RNA polymerase sigma-70 factor (ECF subfamily)